MTRAQIEKEEALLAVRLVPAVKSLKLLSEKFLPLADACEFEVEVPDDCAAEAVGIIADNAHLFWNATARVAHRSRAGLDRYENPEGYSIKVSDEKVFISAGSAAGVRLATYTLRQLSESERGVRTSNAFLLPCVEVVDEPALPFRGMHLCWFPCPETKPFEIERSIRMAAYYKFNYVVLESWGVLRFRSHPEFCWDDRPVEPGEISRLVRLARDLGVTLIPQFNIFGHASASRSITGKHVLLDRHPEFAPLFEPDGWCWCLSNPETRRFLADLVRELDDLYDRPPFFHLGCDEARGAASCALCRRADYPALLLEHLKYFGDLLKERGARPLIWHDMLLDCRDERWSGYIVCGNEDFVEMLGKIPKDFIICDWQYGYPSPDGKEPEWPTTRYFKKHGFDTIVCPWLETRGTLSLGRMIRDIDGFGMLGTTWHKANGADLFRAFYCTALASWSPDTRTFESTSIDSTALFDSHVRDVTHDMGCKEYEEFGLCRRQIHGPDYLF